MGCACGNNLGRWRRRNMRRFFTITITRVSRSGGAGSRRPIRSHCLPCVSKSYPPRKDQNPPPSSVSSLQERPKTLSFIKVETAFSLQRNQTKKGQRKTFVLYKRELPQTTVFRFSCSPRRCGVVVGVVPILLIFPTLFVRKRAFAAFCCEHSGRAFPFPIFRFAL